MSETNLHEKQTQDNFLWEVDNIIEVKPSTPKTGQEISIKVPVRTYFDAFA